MTDWDSRYKAGEMPWEKGHAAPPLMEAMEILESAIWGSGPILVPGCGYGHDVRALEALGVPVLGMDLSETAIAKAQKFPSAGLSSFKVGDFLDGEMDSTQFSALWEHTCYCAIHPSERDRYAMSAAKCIRSGGLLAGVFFLNPFDPEDCSEGPPFPATQEEIIARFAPWFEWVDGWVPCRAYPGRENREWLGIFRRLANP